MCSQWGGVVSGRGERGGSLGSRSSSPRQPQPECWQATYSYTRPLRRLLYRLEAKMGALGWTPGEDSSHPPHPYPHPNSSLACVCVEDQVRELKGLGPGKGGSLPERLHPRPALRYRARLPRAPPGRRDVRLSTEGHRPVDLFHWGTPLPPPMGNSHCVPQAPRRLRASFSRKPSLKGNR